MIFFAEDFLWNGIREFIAHYHGGEIIKAWKIGLSLQSNGSPQKQELSDEDNGSAACSIITIETRREGTDMPESYIWILRDRDPMYTKEFLSMLADSGIQSVKLPPR